MQAHFFSVPSRYFHSNVFRIDAATLEEAAEAMRKQMDYYRVPLSEVAYMDSYEIPAVAAVQDYSPDKEAA